MSIYHRGGTKFVDYRRNPTIELVIPSLQIASQLLVGTGRPKPRIVGAGDKYRRDERLQSVFGSTYRTKRKALVVLVDGPVSTIF